MYQVNFYFQRDFMLARWYRVALLLTPLSLCFGNSDSEDYATLDLDDEDEEEYTLSAQGENLQECPPSPAPQCQQESVCCPYEHRLQIGGNYTYCWITPDGNSTTKGSLGGVVALYEYRPLQSIYAGAAFGYRIGNTTNSIGSRKLQDFNSQVRIGYTFCPSLALDRFTLFTGVGARFMPEKVKVGSASLDFDYTTFYVPLGFLAEFEVSDYFSIGCNFQWMPQVFPIVRISPLSGAWWDLTYQLCNFFVEVPFMFSFCNDRYALSINPFFETWRDGRSKAETLTGLTLSLPGNKYTFTGVNINFAFSF